MKMLLLTAAVIAGALPALYAAGPAHPVSLGHGLFEHDSNCTAKCNDEELGGRLGGMRPPYECWGEFEHSCEWEGDDHAGKKVFKCHGAFAGARNSSSSGDDDVVRAAGALASSDEPSAFARCEGAATLFIKVAAKDEAAASVEAFASEAPEAVQTRMPRKGLAHGNVAEESDVVGMIFGYRCLGEMTFLHLPESNATKTYTACKMDNVRGIGHKHFSSSARSMPALLAELDAPREAAFLTEHVARTRSHPGFASHFSNLFGRSNQHAPLTGKVCSRMCNGKKPPFNGWFPCVGSLDIKCKGQSSEGDTSYDLDMTCEGVSLPVARICRGLWTTLMHVAKGDEKPVTQLLVDTGTTGNREIKKNGWAASITYGRGLHYIHGSK